MDGRGYPDRLAGEDIPLDARILAVADAYNAMTSTRPYRDAMPPDLARNILIQNQGAQHDAYIVGAFIRVLDAHDHAYATAQGGEFASSLNLVMAMGLGSEKDHGQTHGRPSFATPADTPMGTTESSEDLAA
jgi:hypothetical protein